MSEQDNKDGLQAAIDAIKIAIAEEDYEQAQSDLEQAQTSFGDVAALVVVRAELELELENYDACLEIVKGALSSVEDPKDRAQLLIAQGYSYFYLDQIEAARAAFNDAVRANNELTQAFVGRAMVHEHRGFLHAAMLDLNRVIEMDPEDSEPLSIRASIFLRTGNLAEAERDYAAVLEIDEYDEEGHLELARLQVVGQRTSDAMETLEWLVEEGEDPQYVVPAALLRSQLSLTLGSTEAGAEDAKRAIDLQPEQPWGYLQLAACHLEAMNPTPALEALKKAEEMVDDARDLPDLFVLRAAAYEQLEKPEKAAKLRNEVEGSARLPKVVYGPALNPAQNIPLNPNKPIDVRGLLTELFGDAKKAPTGYEKAIRDVVDKLPEIVAQNPGVGRIQIELPQAPGMTGPPRSLIIQVQNNANQPAAK